MVLCAAATNCRRSSPAAPLIVGAKRFTSLRRMPPASFFWSIHCQAGARTAAPATAAPPTVATAAPAPARQDHPAQERVELVDEGCLGPAEDPQGATESQGGLTPHPARLSGRVDQKPSATSAKNRAATAV